MDHLVLIRVADALHRRLRDAVLREIVEETDERIRLVFEGAQRTRAVVVSLRRAAPWIGRSHVRTLGRRREGAALPAAARRALHGEVVQGVVKLPGERVVRFDLSAGHAVVVELATHRATLVLLDADRRVEACARRPRSAAERLRTGERYRPPRRPEHWFDPFGADGAAIDRFLDERAARGTSPRDALRRHALGIGPEGAALVLAEARASGRSPGQVLAARLGALERGECDPVIEAPDDPREAARAGVLDPDAMRLLPWEPTRPSPGTGIFRGEDAAATAGLYYDTLEQLDALRRRGRRLRTLLEREIRRLRQAGIAAERDLATFEDPEVHRRRGEALLAGLAVARRVGDGVIVPDPYDAEGGEIVVPAPPGLSLPACADEQFRRHRRALRGLRRAAERRRALADRRGRLERLADRQGEALDGEGAERLERAMREEGIPVGLEPVSRRRAGALRAAPPRLEGVRMFTTSEGLTLLVGRSARDNHRLTFRLASPEDFWFHAMGHRGAHVVLRNDERRTAPPRASLVEAAAAAAWFSEARDQPAADVQWTRRKYVRKPRGAPPGTVKLKRHETIRVRPTPPRGGPAEG